MRKLFKILGLPLLLLLLLWACRKPTVANWDVDVVLPIAKSHLTIQNFIGDSIFKADNAGLLHLAVTREITAIKVDSILKLPDTTIVKSFTVPALQPTPLPPGQPLNFFPVGELNFNINNGVALRRADIRNGVLNIKFSNDLTQPLDMTYLISSATKNGQPLVIQETIPPGQNSLTRSYDLAGYSLNMRGISGNAYSTIVQSCTIQVNPNADTAIVNYGQGAKMELSYKDIVPQYMEGYFGQQTINIPLDTAKLNLVENFNATNFMLADATLNFKIMNEFGAEFSASLNNIKALNTSNNIMVALNTTQLSNINVNRANLINGNVIASAKTVSLTTGNSNIAPFLSNLPDRLSYGGSVQVNPLGNISGYNDFAYYGKGISVLADIDIPMRFNADNFMLRSNASIDLGNVSQLDNIKGGNLVIQANNGYPFRARLQAYLLDEQGHIFDSLLVPGKNTLDGGQLDSQNMVVAPNFSRVLIPVGPEIVSQMRKSKSIQIVAYFLMPPNPPNIRIYDTYAMDVNIIAELTYNVKRN